MGIARNLAFIAILVIFFFLPRSVTWWPPLLVLVVFVIVDHYRDKKAFKRIERETDEMLATADLSTEKEQLPESCAEVQSLLSRARKLGDEGRLADMELPLRRILEIEPDHAEALADLGDVLVTTGNPREAIVHFERSAAIFKVRRGWAPLQFYTVAMLGLATALCDLERYDDASDAYRKVLEFVEREENEGLRNYWLKQIGICYASALLDKPILYRREGDVETATGLLRQVIEIDARQESELLLPRLLLAKTLSEQGDRNGAIQTLRDALFVAERFRSLEEGRALPNIHARLAELFDEEIEHEKLFWLRQEARLRSIYHGWRAGREEENQTNES